MKKIIITAFLFITIESISFAQLEINIADNITVETTGGLIISGVSSLDENTTGYLKGVVESSPLSGATEFAGLTFSGGFTGTIKRITGSSYAKGNEEGTNFARYYEINNTGSAGTVNLIVDTETSGTNDESNGLIGPYFLYTHNTTGWKGNGFGSSGSTVSANNVNLPIEPVDLVISEGVGVKAKIFLQGPYNTSSDDMNTTINGDIPPTSPYSADARTATTKPSTVVDWVLVELRDQTTPSTVIASRSAYLNSDGNLIDDNETSERGIGVSAAPGSYYLVIKHRNHLGVMSSSVQSGLTWGTASSVLNYDFTAANAVFTDAGISTPPMAEVKTGIWAMWNGDANNDGSITNADKAPINSIKVYEGYSLADLNFDGSVTNADKAVVNNNKPTTPQTHIP